MTEETNMTDDTADQNAEVELNAAADESVQQGDIDQLFGNGDADLPRAPKEFASIEDEIIHASMNNYEKLPMLNVVFERLVMSLTSSLKQTIGATTDVQIKNVTYLSYGEAINNVTIPNLLSVVRATEWNNNFILSLDAPFLYSALEIMLGGRASKPTPSDGRTFTGIEKRIGHRLSETILSDMSEAFGQVTDVNFAIERAETNPQFASISQHTSPCIMVTMKVVVEGRTGSIDFIIPYMTIEPIRGILSKVFFGEKLGADEKWRSHLSEEIKRTGLDAQAVLHEVKMPLEDILNWKRGTTFNLYIEEDHEVTLVRRGLPLAKGKMGKKKNESKAIKISQTLFDKDTDPHDLTDY